MNTIYIRKPHFSDLPSQSLRYTDILTYVAIRSFKNSQSHNCFPAYETIAKKMGASRSFVIDSVDRLMNAEYIYKHKVAYLSNQYYFKNIDISDRIPPEVLSLDLTIYEKAMLLVLRQFCEGLPNYTHYNVGQMANQLGISYKTVYTQLKSLIDKGFVKQIVYSGCKSGGYRLLPVVDWFYEYDMPEHLVITDNKIERLIFIY